MGKREHFLTVAELLIGTHYGEQMEVPQEAKKEVSYDPAIPLPGMPPDKNIVRKDPCSRMLTAVLSIIARPWKQPKRPLIKE